MLDLRTCAICSHLCLEPCRASGHVGVWTASRALIERAEDVLPSPPGDEQHVVITVCPEHVVDIYRSRVPGVRMAWKLAPA